MYKPVSLIFTLFLSILLSAQLAHAEKFTIEQVCELTPCREAKTYIFKDEGGMYEQQWSISPYFYDNSGSIIIGENISFEAVKDALGNITLSYIPKQTTTSINIELNQPYDSDSNFTTNAKIENNSPYNLIYHGGIISAKTGEFRKTSVCAILSGMSSYENWAYPVLMFTFSNFKDASKEEALNHGCK